MALFRFLVIVPDERRHYTVDQRERQGNVPGDTLLAYYGPYCLIRDVLTIQRKVLVTVEPLSWPAASGSGFICY